MSRFRCLRRPPRPVAIDKAALEAYLRHAELWIPQVSVNIDDPKPSAYLPGFSEFAVHLSYQGQSKDEHYYVSQNGKNIIKGEVYDLGKSPFQATSTRSSWMRNPAMGSPARRSPSWSTAISNVPCARSKPT